MRGEITKQDLVDSVTVQIDKYAPILAEHRGIKQALYDIINAVLFIPGLIKACFTGKFRFFKAETTTLKIVDEVHKNIPERGQ